MACPILSTLDSTKSPIRPPAPLQTLQSRKKLETPPLFTSLNIPYTKGLHRGYSEILPSLPLESSRLVLPAFIDSGREASWDALEDIIRPGFSRHGSMMGVGGFTKKAATLVAVLLLCGSTLGNNNVGGDGDCKAMEARGVPTAQITQCHMDATQRRYAAPASLVALL